VKSRFLSATAMSAVLSMVFLASPAMAQKAPSTDFDQVTAGTYKVEPYHTQIGFSISHFGFSEFSGFFSGASGTLTLDPSKVGIAKLEISVPVQSILTTVPVLNEQLKGTQWFDVAKFPNATFVSTSVSKTGRNTMKIVGDLTLHGVTKPTTLTAHLVGAGTNPLDKAYTVGFEASGVINRGDFGVALYLPMVGNAVTLRIAGAFVLPPK
jgi:polyisoprenoid-binding protein YceI